MSVVDELERALGRDRVSVDEQVLDAHSGDWSATALIARRSGRTSTAACVVKPQDHEGLRAVLACAVAAQVPVVPFGGGSSVCRGIEPDGMIVVDLLGMSEILDLDERSRTVRVQAGAKGGDVQTALEPHGLMLGHQPQSMDISTAGGWVATRACGQLSAGYGGIEDAVVGLAAILPTGEEVTSRTTPRSSVGPDLRTLMIGSEGTLGIVTEATLRVHPIPAERAGVALRFDHMADGVAACRKLAQSSLRPAVVRLYDRDDAALFLRNHPDEPIAPLLILAFDGEQAGHRSERAVQLTAGERADPALVAHWWAHRNDAVEEYRRLMSGDGILGPHALIDTMEVSGSWSRLRDLYHSMKERLAEVADLCACHISHVYGDGACLYFTLASAEEDDQAALERHLRWWRTGMETCLAAGGSISHHHGIGRLKVPWVVGEVAGWFGTLRKIKQVLDPHRIMNPGVLGL